MVKGNKFFKKKPVVLDPLSIEMDEYQLALLFIRTWENPDYDDIRDSMEEHFAKDDFIYHCEDEKEKEMIEEIIN
jgi:hypothetical protein